MKRTIASATSSDTRLAARLHHRAQGLLARHARETHAVLRDRGHDALQALEMREIVLAQRDQHAVVGAGKVESLRGGLVLRRAAPRGQRRPVLDEIREVIDELPRALPAGVVRLGEREDLLELVEDQQRHQGLAAHVAQQVVAVVQELPQRLALDRGPGLRPLASLLVARKIACLICSDGGGDSGE